MKTYFSLFLALLLALCWVLSPACLAESSHSDDFFAGLSQAWDGLLGMAEDAGQNISEWANESGVTEWIEGARDDIVAWADESGLAAWAQGALSDITTWAEDSGLTDWTQEIASSVQAFIDEYGPEVQAWLAEASEEVKSAWNTLIDADEHTEEEVQAALETVEAALESDAGTN